MSSRKDCPACGQKWLVVIGKAQVNGEMAQVRQCADCRYLEVDGQGTPEHPRGLLRPKPS